MNQNIKEAFEDFPKPSIAIDSVILRVKDTEEYINRQVSKKQLQVLLVKKSGEAQWHLPGTILRLGEVPKDAIERILNENISVEDIKLEQLYSVTDDLFRDIRGHIISIVYIGMINKTPDKIINDSYEQQWFWIGKPKDRIYHGENTHEATSRLMYDHERIIDDTINRLKGKLMYTDIAFNFIDKEFTITELENVFVAINERSIPSFRRYIANKIKSTGKKTDGNAFRPAELFIKKE